MNTLERYLNLATRGLWGQKKRDVRRELEGNIREMALEFRIVGLNETESIQKALLEFGAPQKVSLGMSKIYTGPAILRNTFLTATIASLCISSFSASRAAIETSDRFPAIACADQTVVSFDAGIGQIPCAGGDYWFNIASLKAELEPKGVKFQLQMDLGNPSYSVSFPGGNPANLQMLGRTMMFQDYSGAQVTQIAVQPDSVRLVDFFTFLQSTGLPVTFEDSKPTRIKVGRTTFEINTTSNPNHTIFESLLESALEDFFPAKPVEERTLEGLVFDRGPEATRLPSGFQNYTIRIKTPKPGASYLMISRENSKYFFDTEVLKNVAGTSRRVRIAKLDQTSSFTYASIAKSLQVQSELKIRKELSTKGLFIEERFDLQATTPDQPGQVMLLEFTGLIDKDTFKILTPDQFTISAK